MKKPLVICDVDGVILDWFTGFLKFINERLGLNTKYEESTSHDLSESFGIDRDLMKTLSLEYDQGSCDDDLPIIPGSLASLKLIQERYDVVLATSCGRYYEEPRKKFFARNLPGVPIQFTSGKANDFSGIATRPNKLEVAKALKAVYLIDDNEKEFELWDSSIAQPICYPQPWNRQILETHPTIPRLSWPDITKLLLT